MPRISDEQAKPAIVFDDVRKTFKIKHTHSFKESFIATLRRKELSSDFNAVDGVTFEVPAGQSVALMGRNGSGKSTTLKMLSGVLQPDNGWVRTRGRVAGLLEVGAGFHPDLTGRQNVYLNAAILGMSKDETDTKFEDILEFSEIGDFIDTEVKRYSSGMYARLGFSVAVHTEVDVLLVDEILSVGDAAFRRKCETKMLELRDQGRTMFIVSHNIGQVKKLCERGIVLERGKIAFDGPINEAADFLNPPPPPSPLPHAVDRSMQDYYEKRSAQYGNPVGPVQPVPENGGGLLQEFERGLITTSNVLPGDSKTMGITLGVFHSAYTRAGGPSGPWGFIAGPPRGRIEDFGTRAMPFQNGIAQYSIDSGLKFTTTGTSEFDRLNELYESNS